MSTQLYFEIATAQLNKVGEELCGDSIIVNRDAMMASLILADGLASGVKANILSTLTTTIISGMLQNGRSLHEVVETLTATLPMCSYRKLAYSTFSIAKFFSDGMVHVVEYDNPPAIYIHNNVAHPIEYVTKVIQDKQIQESTFQAELGDWLVFMSDGEVHAGIGGIWNLGWSLPRITEFLERIIEKPTTAQELANELTNIADMLYAGKPGDDTSVAVIRVREKNLIRMLIGVPKKPELDSFVVERLFDGEGVKIVCGGTTGNVVARELKQAINVELDTLVEGIPPLATIKGVDLCTEGIITISEVLKLLKKQILPPLQTLQRRQDAVSQILYQLLQADDILFIVGQAMNPAHQNPNVPEEFGLKTQITVEIAKHLSKMNKHITIEFY